MEAIKLTCLMCKKEIIDAKVCEKYCAIFHFNDQEILHYNYCQIIKNKRYKIVGNNAASKTTQLFWSNDLRKEPKSFSNNLILETIFQPITSQEDYRNLIPRLLKLKFFI